MQTSSGSCLNDAELRLILTSACAPEDQARYEDHLDGCDECCRRIEEISGRIHREFLAEQSSEGSAILDGVMAELRSRNAADWKPLQEPENFSNHARAEFPYLAPSSQDEYLGRLGNYEIVREIGRGGMGIVFAALDPILNREVAIKVPSASILATPAAQDRFLREARAIAAVRHDNIVTIYAAEAINETLFLVMELVHGASLAERLRSTPKLSWEDVVKIGQEVAAALAAAHEIGVVHRDVTPANILLEDATGRIKVMDFGLAKSAMEAPMTATSVLVGTPGQSHLNLVETGEYCFEDVVVPSSL